LKFSCTIPLKCCLNKNFPLKKTGLQKIIANRFLIADRIFKTPYAGVN
jgi:hypothetical protein